MRYQNGKRYYTMAQYCRERYGARIVKIPLCSGASCPNRDGTKGRGGCTFCSGDGGGEFSPKGGTSLAGQFKAGETTAAKWPGAVKLGYFQSFSNTHTSPDNLSRLLSEAASIEGIGGIRIATRADCIDACKADILAAMAEQLPVEVELGLQTVHDETARAINRCHSFEEWLRGFELLKERGLYVCVHLINGLPGETEDMMLQSTKALSGLGIGGIKLHMLHIIEGSALAERYREQPFELLGMERYVDVVCGQIRLLSPDTVIERLTGDGRRDTLIAPDWTRNKRKVLNAIDKRLAELDAWQGDKYGG